MVKKIVLGTLLVMLVGFLVAGAIIRTVDKTGSVAEASGLGHGRGYNGEGSYVADSLGQGSGYARGGYGGEGNTDAPGDGTGTGQAVVDEWLTLQGTVVSVDADTLVVQTADGEQVTMENRPWWFAQEQGFTAQVGDQVTLVGFYEDGDFEVGQIDNLSSGQAVTIRDENGRPMWAGRGRRGG
jgi:hypothetical protein